MRKQGSKDKVSRVRRTKQEITQGLTLAQVRKLREEVNGTDLNNTTVEDTSTTTVSVKGSLDEVTLDKSSSF